MNAVMTVRHAGTGAALISFSGIQCSFRAVVKCSLQGRRGQDRLYRARITLGDRLHRKLQRHASGTSCSTAKSSTPSGKHRSSRQNADGGERRSPHDGNAVNQGVPGQIEKSPDALRLRHLWVLPEFTANSEIPQRQKIFCRIWITYSRTTDGAV